VNWPSSLCDKINLSFIRLPSENKEKLRKKEKNKFHKNSQRRKQKGTDKTQRRRKEKRILKVKGKKKTQKPKFSGYCACPQCFFRALLRPSYKIPEESSCEE